MCPLNRSSGFVNERDPGDITAQDPLSVCAVLDELNVISIEDEARRAHSLSEETRQELAALNRVDGLTDDDHDRCRQALMSQVTWWLRLGHQRSLREGSDRIAREFHKTCLKLGGCYPFTWEDSLKFAGREPEKEED